MTDAMATVDEDHASNKHDDFFDDAPVKPSMNGHVSPAPEPEQEQTTAGPDGGTEPGAPVENGEVVASKPEEEGGGSTSEPEQKIEVADEAEERTDSQAANVGVDTATENGVGDAQHEETDGNADTTESPAPDEQQQQQQLTVDDGGDATDALSHAPSADPSESDVGVTLAPPASRQSEYEEDFSETSNIASARNTPAEGKSEEHTEQKAEEEAKEKSADKSRSSSSSSSHSSKSSKVNTPEPRQETEPETTTTTAAATVADPAQSPAPPTADVTSRPATSEGGERVDSRAEAAQVIPVTPPPGPDATKAEIDGRSSSAGGEELTDEAYRGEDRTEMIAPEGSEDCRGQGQWKTAEQQAITSAMMVSKSERELTEEAVKERDHLRNDHDALKTQILSLEAEVDKKNEQILVDKEILARKDKEISDLQRELENSNSMVASSEADESRLRDRALVKDLQERLAVLARENEEKDKRVFKLEAELKEAQTRLRETERRLLHAESNQGQEAPKSKTCVIM